MALIDSLDILSDKQVVNNTCYSRYCKKFKAPSDWGQTEMQRYIEILCHGTHAHPLTVQVVGSNNDSHSDEFVICQTTEIPVAKLKAGYKFFIPIPPIGQKYRYLALKYLPTGGSNPAATAAVLTGGVEVTDFATLKGVTDGSFKITVDGEEITATAIDLSSQSAGSGIASALTAKMNSKATVTYANNKFVVTSATTGASSTITAMSGGGSGTDISEMLGLAADNHPVIVNGQAGGSASEGGDLCPVEPVIPIEGGDLEEIPNAISAFFTLVPDFDTTYPMVNADKTTA